MTVSPTLLEVINTVRSNKGLPSIQHVEASARLREELGLDSLDLAELTARLYEQHRFDVFATGLVFTAGEVDQRIRDGRKS